jgi:ATP-dependent helicase/nuclease subunit A
LIDKLRRALRAAGRADLSWEVDAARIGTIHRFCGELLHEFALRRGGNPAPEVIEEGEARALAADAASDALIDALERQDVPGWEDLVTRHGARKITGYLQQLLDRSDVARNVAAHGGVAEDERALVTVAMRALGLVERRLEERGLIDFDRMITWSRDLLRHDAGARAALRRKLHTFIVDEFQDVDPVQQEIAYLIGDPLSRDPTTPRLMLVGDPKQSIYRFRYADVSGWRRVEAHYREGAGRIFELNENYRSSGAILGFVDHVLGPALDTPIEGERADWEVPFASVTAADPELTDGPPVELLVIPSGSQKLKTDHVREIEAQWIARRARELHGAGTGWGQMAVLLPAWEPAERIRDALRRQGAPVWIARDEGLLECREVVDCIMALEAIRDPEDDRALFGFLRSPFVGVTDEMLFAVADAVRPPYWRRIKSIDGPDAQRMQDGIVLLERLVTLRDRVTVDELLDELLNATGYVAHLALMGPDRDQAIANIRAFSRMTRGLKHAGLGEFLKGVEEMRERQDRVPEAVLHGQNEDVLTIASIHAAKGLEWDVVFWSDVARGVPPGPGALIVRPDGIILRGNDDEQWKTWVAREEHEQLAERKRLWYVAATRAGRRLIVSALSGDFSKLKPHQAAHWLARGLDGIDAVEGTIFRYVSADGREHEGIVRVAVPDRWETAPPAEESAPLRALGTLPAPPDPVAVVLGRPRHSATSMLAFSRCERRHWFKYVIGLREPPVDRGGTSFISAVARGQIVHDVLERYREEDELDALLEDAIGRWDDDAPPPETAEGSRYRDHLREEVQLVADHPDYRDVADKAGAVRERRFLYIRDSGDVFEGAIDLMAPDEECILLLDVKTPQVKDPDLVGQMADRYAPQRDVYVSAAEAVAGRDVARFAFQFSRAATQVSQPIDETAREAIRQTLNQRTAAVGVGEPQLTAYPSECFFCGYKKIGWCGGVRRERTNQ